MPREISEYSIWRSEMGAVAAARRMVSGADLAQADVPDVPLHQLWAIAPTVSSIGTFGSSCVIRYTSM